VTATTSPRRRSLKLPRGRLLPLEERPLVMGVVNLTPDSFSDGGLYLEPARALEHGLRLLEEGADLLDLGAESTRPGGGVYGSGARTLTAEEELDRLLPVLEELRRATDAPLSVDTRKGPVARAVLAAGADLVNDISLLSDPDLGRATAAAGCPLVLMHSRGELATMQQRIHFEDLLGEIRAELAEAVDRAVDLGVVREQIVVDPGIGFGKSYAQNGELLARFHELEALGLPILIGASRKSFLGHLTGGAPPQDRLAGSLAAVGRAALGGAAFVRVHDVRETVRFLAVWQATAPSAPTPP
jgi:dihydropteroate synthase